MTGFDGIAVEDMTRADFEGRERIARLVAHVKANMPGFERAFVVRRVNRGERLPFEGGEIGHGGPIPSQAPPEPFSRQAGEGGASGCS